MNAVCICQSPGQAPLPGRVFLCHGGPKGNRDGWVGPAVASFLRDQRAHGDCTGM
ncbi:hypothetical protein AGABI2DRAFT_190211 [Agaricus bisporus var. bisporus H97]|uniref:hypothetical protein n=1 Tax=Agaricus bisporus var. bisporus (strain H97 / ATCC MYA-4626 / FGSC 10389) TaxID=936046 RepID=UPI00029F515F|nr:hypothetical protein AGABI2DRAFT_190211 [Agaricus bisporus var. bisporus H97]EKV49751.1 hypothetical protein AGABI2DRAFT_190211 [Agaricus bisporus var. bisporus H97]